MTEGTERNFHKPALLNEAITYLNVRPGEKYVDATVGSGGHTAAVLDAGGVVLAIDADLDAVRFARKRFAAQSTIVYGNFKNIDEIAKNHGFEEVSGILYDLGMSSWQLEHSGRGFSFLKNEPLDMRTGPTLAVRAEDLLAGLGEKELNELFSKFAQEKRSRAIARACVSARRLRPLKTTQELCGLLAWVERGETKDFWSWYADKFVNNPDRFGSYDRRARIFQALRIVVNDEFNNLKISLPRALRLLKLGGRLVVISFHSLEDGIVKGFGKRFAEGPVEEHGKEHGTAPKIKILARKPMRPSAEEIKENPRARSARLRAFERIS